MASFQDILNKPSSEIEAPKPLPVGTYLAVVDGLPEHKQLGANKTDAFVFNFKFMQPGPDVDTAALQENLKGKSLTDRFIKVNQFVTEDAVWRMKKMLVEGLGIEEGTRGLGEMIPEAMGRQVWITIGHRASDDGQSVYMEAKGFAKV